MQHIVFNRFFTIILALGWSQICVATEEWKALTSGQNNLSLAIDISRVVVEGKKVTFWERVEFIKPDQVDEVSGRLIKFKRIQRVMDCETRMQGVLRGSLFGENNKLIEAIINDSDKVQMSAIPPGTVAEQELALVCSQGQSGAEPAGSIPPKL
jgi:regulator of extracellular matrix RemA (YlzA/DUF370 family)